MISFQDIINMNYNLFHFFLNTESNKKKITFTIFDLWCAGETILRPPDTNNFFNFHKNIKLPISNK